MNEEKITIWEERIHACQNSDLTVAAWRSEHQISVATYYYWRKRVCCQWLCFIFCNRRRNSIKVLRYDANGFVLATKKLLDGMKFQWPKDEKEVDEISEKQLEWLLEGLEIEQKKAHHPVDMSAGNNCF